MPRPRNRGGATRRRSLSVSKPVYDQLAARAKREGIPVRELIERMIAQAELEEQRAS